MKLRTVCMLASALAVTACHLHGDSSDQSSNEQSDTAAAPLKPDASEDAVCQSISGESSAGRQSMEVALTKTYAEQLGGTRLDVLTKSGDYNHTGAEMLNGHCWTRAELSNDPNDPVPFRTSWRCPVLMVSGDPKQPDQTIVDDVDSNSCDFNVPVGAPSRQTVQAHMIRLAAP